MSRFVSAGELEKPAERDDEWVKAKKEVEQERNRKLEAGKQEGGKSLYEVLQANKAAKQEAFEEKVRLSNRLAALEEDEVEYLDSLREVERAKEAALRRETSEQLALFRRQQEEAERQALAKAGSPVEDQDSSWVVKGKKRKKSLEKGSVLGVKARKAEAEAASSASTTTGISKATSPVASRPTASIGIGRVQEDATSGSPPKYPDALQPSLPTSHPQLTASVIPSQATKSSSGAAPSPTIITKTIATSSVSALGLGLDDYSSEEE